MISRRRLFGWLSGFIGGAVGVPAVLKAATPGIDEASHEFIRLQKWFRDHPHLLWATPYFTEAELVRQRAVRLGEPFHAANPHIGYDAWVDHCTDNVLMKVYHRRRNGEQQIEIGLGCALTRLLVEDHDPAVVDAEINASWVALTNAVNTGEWEKGAEGNQHLLRTNPKIMGLAQLKTEGGGYPM